VTSPGRRRVGDVAAVVVVVGVAEYCDDPQEDDVADDVRGLDLEGDDPRWRSAAVPGL